MFAMTAAHPTAPLPSYARVSNPRSGRSVIVRVNDRGPFIRDVFRRSFPAPRRIASVSRRAAAVTLSSSCCYRRLPRLGRQRFLRTPLLSQCRRSTCRRLLSARLQAPGDTFMFN